MNVLMYVYLYSTSSKTISYLAYISSFYIATQHQWGTLCDALLMSTMKNDVSKCVTVVVLFQYATLWLVFRWSLPVKNDYLETAMLAPTDGAMKTIA